MTSLEKNPLVRGWFSGRRVLVVGLGKSGVAAATLLNRLGARVAVTEKKSKRDARSWIDQLPPGLEVETGDHRWLSRPWDLRIASPGVDVSPWRGEGPIWGELELGYRVLSLAGRWPSCSAAVTGTNGKTTTTALLGAMFRSAGRSTVVAGNMGVPLCSVVDRITPTTALVLEVSSYQLETADAFRPTVGAVLNVTPDHLARHKTLATYAKTKFRLFQSQRGEDAAVLNAADPWCHRWAPMVSSRVFWFGESLPGPGVFWDGSRLRGRGLGGHWKPPRHLPGPHNLENALAAVACARRLGIDAASIAKTLASFRGVEHRLEFVREWRGVRFINDSKATNVDSTRVALAALAGPLRVILGGQDKGAPYAPLAPLLRAKVQEVLLIGEASSIIEKELGATVPLVRCDTLERAVTRAAQTARAGETVLLSPACASFDQFDHFEHRGRCFKEQVAQL